MKCMSYCPKKAIETGHGYIAAFVLLFNAIILVAFYKIVNNYFYNIDNVIIKFVVESALTILLIGIWYRLIHWLLRIKLFERITVYTSLTKYKWWGRRYKALKE